MTVIEKAVNIPSLTKAMARSEEAAFQEFFALYFNRLLRYLLVLANGDEELAREAAQSTLLRVARHVRQFDSEDVFWSWLTVMARSSLIDERRKSSRYLVFLRRWLEHQQPDQEALQEAQAEDRLANSLENGLKELPEEDRQLIMQKYFDGQFVHNIAEAAKLS